MSVTDDNGYVPFAVVKGISLKTPKRSIKSVNRRRTDKPMAKRNRKAFKIMTLPPGIPGSLASLLLAKTVY
jgi:hypothetical protein